MGKGSGGTRGEDKTHGYKWTQSDIDRLTKEGWKINATARELNETFANWDLKKNIEEINEHANELGLHVDGVRVNDYSVKFRLKDNQGRLIAYISREMTVDSRRGVKSMENALFEIYDSNYQGKGISKTVLRTMIQGAKRSGYARVDVHANLDVGGYTWAKYGFKARDYSNAMRAVIDSELGRKVVTLYYKNHKTSDPFPMQELIKAGVKKEELMGTSWMGFLDLQDRKQMKYFQQYVNRRG